jgi:predicted dehydrogenase
VAVGSRADASARAFGERFQIAAAHGSYEALLADPNVDAIYLSLPNSMHHEWTIRALEAGKHVLCEKPLAVNEREGREMFDAARAAKRVLVEAFMYVSHPQTHAYLKLVRDGAIGELKLVRTSFSYRTRKIEGNIRFDPKLAGGALMDVGCYCVNFSRLLAGEEPSDIFATSRKHESGVDIATAGTLKFPSGVLATFSCGMNVQCDNTAHVCGTEGYLEIGWPWKPPVKGAMFTLAHSIPPRQDKGAEGGGPPPRQAFTVDAPGELYALEADDFAATVLDGAPARISEENSMGNIRVLDQMRRQIGIR